MPSSLDIGSYPLELYQAAESVLLTRKPAEYRFDSLRAARALRLRFYGLKAALKAKQDHPLSAEAEKLSTMLVGTTLSIVHVEAPIQGLIPHANANG